MSPFTTQWEQEVQQIQTKLHKLSETVLATAVHAIYSGIVPSNQLLSLKSKWRTLLREEAAKIELPEDENIFDLLMEHLTVSREQNHWTKMVDAQDVVTFTTLFNIRITSRFGQDCWPFLLDPFGNAEDWIKLIHRNYNNNEEVYNDIEKRTVILNGDDSDLGIFLHFFISEINYIVYQNHDSNFYSWK